MSDFFGNRYFPFGYFPAGYFGAGEELPPGSIVGAAHGSSAASATAAAVGHIEVSATGAAAITAALTGEGPQLGGGGAWLPLHRRHAVVERTVVGIEGSAQGAARAGATIQAIAVCAAEARGNASCRGRATGSQRAARPIGAVSAVRPVGPVRPLRAGDFTDYVPLAQRGGRR